MEQETYRTIKHKAQGLFRDKGSKFIALAFPVINEASDQGNY
jgi:putative IMPACT (imprinted ancient) family translation regulator